MLEAILKVPPRLSAESILRFAEDIRDIRGADRYVFDFGKIEFVEPFGMLVGGALLRQFMRERKGSESSPQFSFSDYQGHSYASFMGFFQSFGLEHGNEPGQVSGNRRYIPITRLHTRTFYDAAKRKLVVVGEAIEEESGRIAAVLAQQPTGNLVDTLTYSLREIFRNVVEHSGADVIWYAAQYWPALHKVEIGILDEGIGIRAALSKNRKLSVSDDENALHLALQPGISGVMGAGRNRASRYYDPWANSGYGLYMTSSICQRGGEFLICSGSTALWLSQKEASFTGTAYTGTAIRMVLDTTRIESVSKMLNEIRQTGEQSARSSSLGGNLSASVISRMLARAPNADTSDESSERVETLRVSMRVRHPYFGRGTIAELSGAGENLRATINFDSAGRKRVVVKYANLSLVPL